MAGKELRYWDSCSFLRHLEKNPESADGCQAVLDKAQAGEIRIVTSTLTLVECIKLRGEKAIPEADANLINAFFRHEFIIVRQLDRKTAEFARRLVWKISIDPKDAVHVATALLAGCTRFDTTDEKLIKKSPIQLDGYGPLIVKRPTWDLPVQLTIDAEPPA